VHFRRPSRAPRHYALARELIRNGDDVTIIASNFNHATGMQMNCAHEKLCTFEKCRNSERPFGRLSWSWSYHSAAGDQSHYYKHYVFRRPEWLREGLTRDRFFQAVVAEGDSMLEREL